MTHCKKIVSSILTLIFIFASTNGFSEATETIEKESPNNCETKQNEIIKQSNYCWSIGVGLPGAPSIRYGCRSQQEHFGMDYSLQVGTCSFFPVYIYAKADLLFLHYFQSNLKKQQYIGAGLGCILGTNLVCFGAGQHVYCILSPEFTYGIQWQNKFGNNRFLQGQIGFPNFVVWDYAEIILVPQFSVGYGWMF